MHAFETYVLSLAHTLPLELFVTVGSFLEEVIAPIPSPSIMVIAGSFGALQDYSYSGLALLVLFASLGKTVGGFTMYMIARTVKDTALKTFGAYIDISEADIKRFGDRFTGSYRDYAVYIFLRSVPIIPSILLSFGSGVIGLPLRLFLIGTFIGTIVRDTFYLVVGYTGAEILYQYLSNTSHAESIVQYIFCGIAAFATIFLFIRRRVRRNA